MSGSEHAPWAPGYDTSALLHQGRRARIVRATRSTSGADVVLKVLPEALGRAELNQLRDLAGVPGVVPLLDAGTTADGDVFVVLPFYPDGSFGDMLVRRGPAPVQEAAAVARSAAAALGAMHGRGLLHNDVCPGNILRAGRTPVLTGFGSVQRSGEALPPPAPGTEAFLHAAPEVLRGEARTPATDVYQLASTVWTMLAGHAPFSPTDGGPFDARTYAERVLSEEPSPVPRQDVSRKLRGVLTRALAKLPEERFPNASAFAAAFEQARTARSAAPSAGSTGGQAPLPGTREPAGGAAVPATGPQAPPSGPQPPAAQWFPSGPQTSHAPVAPWTTGPNTPPHAPAVPHTGPQGSHGARQAPPASPGSDPAPPKAPEAPPSGPQVPATGPRAPLSAPGGAQNPYSVPSGPQAPPEVPWAPGDPTAHRAPSGPHTPPNAAPTGPRAPQADAGQTPYPAYAPSGPQTPHGVPSGPQAPPEAPWAPGDPTARRAPTGPQAPPAAQHGPAALPVAPPPATGPHGTPPGGARPATGPQSPPERRAPLRRPTGLEGSRLPALDAGGTAEIMMAKMRGEEISPLRAWSRLEGWTGTAESSFLPVDRAPDEKDDVPVWSPSQDGERSQGRWRRHLHIGVTVCGILLATSVSGVFAATGPEEPAVTAAAEEPEPEAPAEDPAADEVVAPEAPPEVSAPSQVLLSDNYGSVELAWTDNSGGTASFFVLGGPRDHPPATLARTGPGVVSAQVVTAVAAVEYCFTVVAVDGASAPSDEVCTTRAADRAEAERLEEEEEERQREEEEREAEEEAEPSPSPSPPAAD
ncbi:protein kinase [Nocardiopsis sp. NPDC101807]|uniref:serine/threonine protein kinase n=1 Tax=Nocardiopsis sp. NPDC101807 TaxID=3364339 RepID=UPI00380C6C65